MSETISVGADLAFWRGRMGWSVKRAAGELRILQPSMRNLESGRKAASSTLLRLAELLEQLEAAQEPSAAPAAQNAVRPVKSRVPKMSQAVPQDPFDAALARTCVRDLRPEALELLKAAVERRNRGYRGGQFGGPGEGENVAEWRARETAWDRATSNRAFGSRLDMVAELVERQLWS
ncbi:hypothetical protein [Lichenicola sp.]|uniref:hypothetical protein n=1 Tax=Lichenicola sp. TaxID=2804529 RepID=UPI003B006F7B